ncbi:MAG TPA: GNAT family N-acetyltransferase [Clostridiales bacterium]|nr:GNAT family N-acetyltransferase [Clostridiales bacterium]
MLLQEDNIVIRNATGEDAEQLCTWWNDGKIMAHAGFPNGLGTSKEEIIRKISTDTDDTRRRLIIDIDKIPVGEMSYHNLGNNIAEIGIKICDFKQQNHGYGSRILGMLIHELFKQGYEKIKLDTNLNNERAQHVYEKIGFRKTGIRVDAWIDQLGESQTAVDYELTCEERHGH